MSKPSIELPPFDRDTEGKPRIGPQPEELYAFGHLIRSTEQFLLEQFSRGLVSGTTHTCIGQELCAMSVVRALNDPEDVVLSNHRNHGHFLTYSGDVLGLVTEIMGREAGVCGGRGGSQHLAYRHFHSNGVQGGMTGIGVGMAFARKRAGIPAVVAAMIGDGTLGEGMLYEIMNLASIWQLPMLFVVENNGIAQTTYTSDTIGGGDIEARGRAFGLRSWRLSDDADDFMARVQAVVEEVRREQQPGFLVIDTRRLGPHSKGDDLRSDAEKAAIHARDPLEKLGRSLPDAVRQEIEARNRTYLEAIEESANASPEAREETPEHIFAHASHTPAVSYPADGHGGNVRQVINDALRHLLENDNQTLLLGEDLHDPYGGAFKVTAGLSSAFPGRVISTPISEAGITGTTIGMAVAGLRPIMEVMFADFLTLCMDQLYNHAVKFPGVFPEMQVPLVIRTPSGGRRGYGPTHSQSPENILTTIPGLTVLYPSHRHAVGRLLVDATQRWLYPTLFFEHKLLYSEIADPGDYRVLPAAPGDPAAELFPTLVRGSDTPDLSIVSYGGMLPVVEQAVAVLEQEEELAVEVLAPSLLSPLPRNTLVGHLLNRPRVLVVEETHHEYGISAEILASLLEAGYRGEALRIGTPPVPIAAARSLERQILPDAEQLIHEILDLI